MLGTPLTTKKCSICNSSMHAIPTPSKWVSVTREFNKVLTTFACPVCDHAAIWPK